MALTSADLIKMAAVDTRRATRATGATPEEVSAAVKATRQDVKGLLSPAASIPPTTGTLTSGTTATATPPIEPTKVTTTGLPSFEADTVESRLDKLLSKDNAYIKTARANAAETANSRGLLNSSIAAGTGEKAAIESALPIATQDASAQNAFRQQEQAFNYNASLQDAAAANEFKLTDKNYQNETKIQEQLFGYNQALQQMNIDADLKMQTTESLQTLAQQYMTERTTILTSPELDEESKQVLLNDLEAYTSQSMALVADMAGFDVSVFDSFTDLGATKTTIPTTGTTTPTTTPTTAKITAPTNPTVNTSTAAGAISATDQLVAAGKISYPVGWAKMTDAQKLTWFKTNGVLPWTSFITGDFTPFAMPTASIISAFSHPQGDD